MDRYRALFENVPIPIREEDLSQLKAKIDALGLETFASLTQYIDENPDFIEACGRAVRIVDANAASMRMHSYEDKNEFKSEVLNELGSESRRFVRRAIEVIFMGQTSDLQETAIYDKDGNKRIVLTNWSILPGHEHDYSRSILCSVDITEKIEAQAASRQAQKMEAIGQLTGGIAHDFNNLLAVIQGNVELLQAHSFGALEQQEILQDIQGAARRGAELVRNMLAFSRQAELEPQVVDVNKIVTTTERWVSRVLPPNVEIETVCQARLWRSRIDPTGLQSAIVNVIVNARDAMPEGGKLTIETSNARIEEGYHDDSGDAIPPGRYVLVAISDTGGGMTEEMQARVFEPFFSTKGPVGGSGLGLAMVQGFARQSGGAARIYSEVGIGTTFKLYVPAHEADTSGVTPELNPARVQEIKERARILVVDDQLEILNMLMRTLSKAGYAVVLASSGDAAFDLFQKDRAFDLVLTDIAMPGTLQGPALARAIREIETTMPVVFLTGYAAEATVHGNGLRSTDIRLMKPISNDDLLKAISKAILAS